MRFPWRRRESQSQTRQPSNWWDKNIPDRHQLKYFLNGIGDATAPGRQQVRDHVLRQRYRSLVDVGAGPAVDWPQYRDHLRYVAVDFAEVWRTQAAKRQMPFVGGSIEALPLTSRSFDVAYSREVLEHLPFYDTALRELARVASKEVIVIFFKLRDQDAIMRETGLTTHHNAYARAPIDQFVRTLPRVRDVRWESTAGWPSRAILHLELESQ